MRRIGTRARPPFFESQLPVMRRKATQQRSRNAGGAHTDSETEPRNLRSVREPIRITNELSTAIAGGGDDHTSISSFREQLPVQASLAEDADLLAARSQVAPSGSVVSITPTNATFARAPNINTPVVPASLSDLSALRQEIMQMQMENMRQMQAFFDEIRQVEGSRVLTSPMSKRQSQKMQASDLPSLTSTPTSARRSYDGEASRREDAISPYTNMLQWLIMRERLYPYNENLMLYRKRYTLLTEAGRQAEYIRFGFATAFPIELYPPIYKQWVAGERTYANLLSPTKKPVERVPIQLLRVPQMSYDRYDRSSASSGNLPERSQTLHNLPSELASHPPRYSSLQPYPTAQDMMNRYIEYLRRKTDSSAMQEQTPIKREQEREEKYVDNSSFPQGFSGFISPKYEQPLPTNGEVRGQFGSPSTNDGVTAQSAAEYVNPYQQSDILMQNSLAQTLQEQKIGASTNPTVVSSMAPTTMSTTSTSYAPSTYNNPLTSLMLDLDPISRALMTLTSGATIATQAYKMALTQLEEFKGAEEKASAWKSSFIATISSCHLGIPESLSLMNTKLKDGAQAWFRSKVIALSGVEKQMRLSVIMGEYQKKYLNTTSQAMYTSRLYSMTQAGKPLDMYYKEFREVLNSLVSCTLVDEVQFVPVFYQSLDTKYKSFINSSFTSMKTIEEVYNMARMCETFIGRERNKREYIAIDHVTVEPTVNAVIRGPKGANKPSTAKEKELDCWWCGKNGHSLPDCYDKKNGKAQSEEGYKLYRAYCKSRKREPAPIGTGAPGGAPISNTRSVNNTTGSSSSASTTYANTRRGVSDGGGEKSPYTLSGKQSDRVSRGKRLYQKRDGATVNHVTFDDEDASEEETMHINTIDIHKSQDEDEYDQLTGTSLGLDIVMNGCTMPCALVDQGATRNVIRRTAFRRLQAQNPHIQAHNFTKHVKMSGSTGEQVQTRQYVRLHIHVDGRDEGLHLFYINEDDSSGVELIADVILGKTFLSRLSCRAVDTFTNQLINPDDVNDCIQCIKACIIDIPVGDDGRNKRYCVPMKDRSERYDDVINEVTFAFDPNNDERHKMEIVADAIRQLEGIKKLEERRIDVIVNLLTADVMKEIEEVDFPITRGDLHNPPDRKKLVDMIKQKVASETQLNKLEQGQLQVLLIKYVDVFSIDGENVSHTDTTMHSINTGDSKPVKQKLRQYSDAIKAIIRKEVESMKKAGVITKSSSPYASNVVLIRKPDPTAVGGIKNRVCIDYKELNANTIKDAYPLPNIQAIFRAVGQAKYFTVMDLFSGFWQIKMDPKDSHKTAFITDDGLFEFNVMPFGLTNAPPTFQRLMDKVIGNDLREFVKAYIDDLLTHSKTFSEHLVHLEKLLQALDKHNLKVKLTKCKFAQTEVKFLGHIIRQNELKPNPETVASVANWVAPTTVRGLRSFLGMANYYRNFVENFSLIAQPLYALVKKDVKYRWSKECQLAFDTLKQKLISYPVLRVPDSNKNYILHTDASDTALGAVLLQEDDKGEQHPVAYASKTMLPAETRYTTTEKECLALIWALTHFNTYLEGHKYTCLTDHSALTYLHKNTSTSNNRIFRWINALSRYEIDLKYKPGALNNDADCLSRADQNLTATSLTISAVNTSKSRIKVNSQSATLNNTQVDPVYEVSKIIGKRTLETPNGDKVQYKVLWKGYSLSEATWESLSNLDGCADYIQEYELSLAQGVDVSKDDTQYKCNQCEEIFMTSPALKMHQHMSHGLKLHDIKAITVPDSEVLLMKTLQEAEPQFRIIYDSNLGEYIPENANKRERQFLLSHEFVRDERGLLYAVWLPSVRTRQVLPSVMKLCVPKSKRIAIIREAHEGKLSAHSGVTHIYDMLRQKVWWPGLFTSICQYIAECNVCQKNKSNKQPHILPRPMSTYAGPWTHVGFDIVGPLPITVNGNKFILVMVDHFTRWVEAVALAEQTTVLIVNAFIKYIVCRYGVPDILQSDRGSPFISNIAMEIYKKLGIKKRRTTAHHPQSNGTTERFNRTLKAALKLWVNEYQDNWDELLHFAIFAYLTSHHSTMKYTPFYMSFARDPKLPLDIMLGKQSEYFQSREAYAHELLAKLYEVHQTMKRIYQEINNDRLAAIELDATHPAYNIDDMVWLHDSTTPVGRSRKLIARWTGPYQVLDKRSDVNYIILKDGKEMNVHVNRLKSHKPQHSMSKDVPQVQLDDAVNMLEAANKATLEIQSIRDHAKEQVDIAQAKMLVNDASVNVSPTLTFPSSPPDAPIDDTSATIAVIDVFPTWFC